jgi:DNA modification methylase
MNEATIYVGNVLEQIKNIPDSTVQCVVTSPPYWGLRNYGHDDQLGLESTPEAYVENMVSVFREVHRILKDDGVLWLNLGDSYNGSGGNHKPHHKNDSLFQGDIGADKYKGEGRNVETLKPKDLVGIPWRVAFALQADGWWLRQDIIWSKPNPLPESITDRCTKAHEYVFLLTKSQRYFFDNEAIKEESATIWNAKTFNEAKKGADLDDPFLRTRGFHTQHKDEEQNTRNKRSVWNIPVKPFRGAHFAVMPEKLVEPCILASSKPEDVVFDPFTGSGTVAVVALNYQRNFIGTELNPEYAEIAKNRINDSNPMFSNVNIIDQHD